MNASSQQDAQAAPTIADDARTAPIAVAIAIPFHAVRAPRGRVVLTEGPRPTATPGKVPRVARLLALAWHYRRLLDAGVVRDQAEIARLSGVTKARITQILNLLWLAPDVQEEILFLAEGDGGRDALTEKTLRPIAGEVLWERQRERWCEVGSRA